jgi:hypothetical protein
MAKEPLFLNCHCPHCKADLDGVLATLEHCPRCREPIDAQAVWRTRKYPGIVEIPPWTIAFTWPLALILLGAFIAWYASILTGTLVLSIGLVFFVFKLNFNSRDI